MLNLDETLGRKISYNKQRDLYLKGLLYSLTVLIFVTILRNQISEVNLLQLIPGFYLILLFISLLIVVSLSDLFLRLPIELDEKKENGTKTIERMEIFFVIKLSFFFLSTYLLIVLNTIVPLSLDSFNFYGEQTLENLWSFDEVLALELILLLILILLSQFPPIAIYQLTTESKVTFFPEFWKSLSLVIFIGSGLLTPTIDGYTQLSFATSAISLYLAVINFIEKRINIKFTGTINFVS